MSESIYTVAKIKKAFSRLPDVKTYTPLTVTVKVDKDNFTFEKQNKEWCLKF